MTSLLSRHQLKLFKFAQKPTQIPYIVLLWFSSRTFGPMVFSPYTKLIVEIAHVKYWVTVSQIFVEKQNDISTVASYAYVFDTKFSGFKIFVDNSLFCFLVPPKHTAKIKVVARKWGAFVRHFVWSYGSTCFCYDTKLNFFRALLFILQKQVMNSLRILLIIFLIILVFCHCFLDRGKLLSSLPIISPK